VFRTSLIVSTAIIVGCAAPRPVERRVDALQRAALYTFNEREVDAYLRWLSADEPNNPARVAQLARKNLGQPYRAFLLGEFPFELRDPDPLYCLSASDCTTFVEQTYALAMSSDWPSFFRTLQRIRYKDGIIGFATRNHFVEADWNPNNAWLFEEITDRLGEGTTKPMQTRVDRAAFLARVGLSRDEPPQIVRGSYVPVNQLTRAASGLRDGDIVELVKGDDHWQYVSHMGLVFHDTADGVTIVHSGKPAVREEPMDDYLTRHPAVIGLRFLRLRPDANSPGRSGLE